MKKHFVILFSLLFIAACGGLSPEAQATMTAASLTAVADSWTETPTSTFTFTPTATLTPTLTFTPTITLTPTITPTPTFAFPTVTVNQQAHCRYGPSPHYLHAADLYAGDKGTARERFVYSKWLYVKFDKLDYLCWVAPSVVDVVGDVSTLKYKELNLQSIGSNKYGPPKGVTAVRDGNKVTITWNQVKMSDDKDRGYLLEAFVCQDGNYWWWTDSIPNQFTTTFVVKDEAGCSLPSSGKLYTVEKHGFSEPVNISWPPP